MSECGDMSYITDEWNTKENLLGTYLYPNDVAELIDEIEVKLEIAEKIIVFPVESQY